MRTRQEPAQTTVSRPSSRSCRAFIARRSSSWPWPWAPWPWDSPYSIACPKRIRMDALAVEGVWKYYGDFPALRDINYTCEAGSCLALIGRNGAGKTTLLRTVAGFSRPMRGKIRILGKEPRETATRRNVGFIGHGIAVYDELSALENLTLYARLYGLDDPRHKALEWLKRTGLERVRDGLVREFSRGMRQRLALARAFLHEPAVLL